MHPFESHTVYRCKCYAEGSDFFVFNIVIQIFLLTYCCVVIATVIAEFYLGPTLFLCVVVCYCVLPTFVFWYNTVIGQLAILL